MTCVRRSVNTKRKRREVLDSARGCRGQRSHLYRRAKEQILHSKTYEFRDRHCHRGQFRCLWIQHINTATCVNSITYSRSVQGLSLADVGVDCENLTELAINDPQAFAALVEATKDALPGDVNAPAAKQDSYEVAHTQHRQASVTDSAVLLTSLENYRRLG